MPEKKKIEKLVRFSICIMPSTLQLIDIVANSERRSRSAMIDVICAEYCQKKSNKQKDATNN